MQTSPPSDGPDGSSARTADPGGRSPAGRLNHTVDVTFDAIGPGTYAASLAASEPDTLFERLKQTLFGPPIPEQLASRERLNRVRALAILSSDALSSVAYGTEASLAVLAVAGSSALGLNLGIGVAIAILMLLVATSYRQTIHAYPSGGGSYLVARENLGVLPGLVAAAALLLDYVLTVAVSLAAGIDALVSAVPALAVWRLQLALGVVLLLVLVNLRGLRASGTLFAVPTYLFLCSFGAMLALGVYQAVRAGGLGAATVPASGSAALTTQVLTPLLVLTAFAAGCSAMTGVEAIANGVPAFTGKTPSEQARHAAQTLSVMVALLVTLFLGTTYLAWRVGAVPMPQGTPTVTAQIARFATTAQAPWLFYVVQTATLLILLFAANTSFAGFPRLAALLADDGYLPVFFAQRGERIVYSTGIVTLGVVGALILWVFAGSVTALINLYALGVFTAFTLSQAGMVVHWLRRRRLEVGWRRRLVANAAGAVATAVATTMIAVAKFDHGAWIIVVLVPLLVVSFLGIRHYYARPHVVHLPPPPIACEVALLPVLTYPVVAARQRRARTQPAGAAGTPAQGTAMMNTSPDPAAPAETWPYRVHDVQDLEAELTFAARIAREVVVLRVVDDPREAEAFRAGWERFLAMRGTPLPAAVRVEALVSPYRAVVRPLTSFIAWHARTAALTTEVAVLLPRELRSAWWEWPLRRRVADRVRAELTRQAVPVTIVDLPFTLGQTPGRARE